MRHDVSPRDESPEEDVAARRLRLEALPEHKRALLEALRARRGRTTTGERGTELLRSGSGAGLVLVHPTGGELLCYGELVRLLPAGYPVHGVGADHMLRTESPPTLKSLVQHYVSRAEQDGIRVGMLAGWSFGGIVAYEMARELSSRGQRCPVVALDAVPENASRPARQLSVSTLRQAFAFDLARSVGLRVEELRIESAVWELPLREAMAVLRSALEAHGISGTLGIDELADRALVHANSYRALEAHRMQPGGPPVNLLWATHWANDPTVWWRAVASEPERKRSVVADHYSLVREPAVSEVAAFVHEVFAANRHD